MTIQKQLSSSSLWVLSRLIVVILFAGCSASETGSGSVSYQSKQDFVKETVLAYPTSVKIPLTEIITVKERLQYFFQNELKTKLQTTPTGFSVSTGRFLYRIMIASPDSEGNVIYSVVCAPRSEHDSAGALLNAKNIARFIRDGTIEKTLGEL